MAMSDIDAGGVVYQLRAVLEGVSPLVWRRLLVTADTSIADMHAIVQTVFGWDDDHLHRFTIHGRDYGISYVGGIGFRDDPHQVRLGDFELRQRERFSYEYDFCAGWRLQLRVEDIRDRNPTRRYPVCVGGRRAIPPESCNGAWDFQAQQDRNRFIVIDVMDRLAECLDDPAALDVHRDALADALPWLRLEHFDRRATNRLLAVKTVEGSWT